MDSNDVPEFVTAGSSPPLTCRFAPMYDLFKTFRKLSLIYIVWIVIHYVASHLYVYFCVPATFIGFLTVPFIVPAPHCQALRWAIYTGGNNIIAMWFLLGAWIAKKIIND
jgi:hypothetical protein